MNTKIFSFMLLATLMLTAIGCNSKVPMGGKVTFSDNQSPLTVGQVSFRSDTVNAFGCLTSDGTYILGTNKEMDGIPKGTYRVTIEHAVESTSTGSVRHLIVPLNETTVVVDGTTTVYDIVVDRAK